MEAIGEIYKAFDYEEYVPYANIDGFEDLFGPDLYPETNSIEIILEGWNLLQERLQENEARIFTASVDSLSQRWRGAGKCFAVEYR